MKTLILGEILNETLSSGTLEIIKKAQDENLDFQVITIGSGDAKEGSLGLNIVLRPSVVLVETPIVPELSPESEPIPAAI